jgi:large subunit ribosomal protein L14e
VALVKATVAGLRLGQKVRSTAGRDQGQTYIIVGFLGDHLLLLANGRERPFKRAKKKNVRHVDISLCVDRFIEERMLKGEEITDEDIRLSLYRWQKELEEGA